VQSDESETATYWCEKAGVYINNTSQLRHFHPDSSDAAIAFREHILDKMFDAQAPTTVIADFGHYVTPEAPVWTAMLVCDHPVQLEIYGNYEVDGELRCTQCVSIHRLWVPFANKCINDKCRFWDWKQPAIIDFIEQERSA
jgi:hypothetical protein